MKNKFRRDTLSLTGGIIIPPFVIADYYLNTEEKFYLSQFLQKHHILGGEFTVSVPKCDCCSHHEWFRDMVNRLQDMYYLFVISIEELDDCFEFIILINPWYLKYIKRNPYYGVFQEDYLEFLKNSILPEIEDVHLREELINTILDNSIRNDLDFENDDE